MPLPSPAKRQMAISIQFSITFVCIDRRRSLVRATVPSKLVSSTQYPLPPCYLRDASSGWGSISTWTVPYALPRTMMCNLHRLFPFLLITSALSLPSSWPYRKGDGLQQAAFQVQGLSKESFREWELPPNPNSTHHLIFNSVSGLLQRWPNTLRRNGALNRSLPIHRTLQ